MVKLSFGIAFWISNYRCVIASIDDMCFCDDNDFGMGCYNCECDPNPLCNVYKVVVMVAGNSINTTCENTVYTIRLYKTTALKNEKNDIFSDSDMTDQFTIHRIDTNNNPYKKLIKEHFSYKRGCEDIYNEDFKALSAKKNYISYFYKLIDSIIYEQPKEEVVPENPHFTKRNKKYKNLPKKNKNK